MLNISFKISDLHNLPIMVVERYESRNKRIETVLAAYWYENFVTTYSNHGELSGMFDFRSSLVSSSLHSLSIRSNFISPDTQVYDFAQFTPNACTRNTQKW